MESDYTEERPYIAFTFGACKGPTPHSCSPGWFETKAGRRVYCDCECHSDAYAAYLEQQNERDYFRGGHR